MFCRLSQPIQTPLNWALRFVCVLPASVSACGSSANRDEGEVVATVDGKDSATLPVSGKSEKSTAPASSGKAVEAAGGAPGAHSPHDSAAPAADQRLASRQSGRALAHATSVPHAPVTGVLVEERCFPVCPGATTWRVPAREDWSFEADASCVLSDSPTAEDPNCTTQFPPRLPPPRAGVVRNRTCFAYCQTASDADDPKAPDWGFEEDAPCIFRGTHTAIGQECMTDQPLPAPPDLDGRNGKVVLDEFGTRICAPLCENLQPSADGDDWDYEYGVSCVVPETATARNQDCVTGEPVPELLPKDGVVMVDASGVVECHPLCEYHIEPREDPEADGWAYEDSAPCVIPGTSSAQTNPECTTGDALPEPMPRDGVVITNEGQATCVPVCTFFLSPTQKGADGDGKADHWAWESNGACVIPETTTEKASLPCTTLLPVPDVGPRPGIYVNSDPIEDSCSSTACVPLCTVATEAANPEYPDWGWEFNGSCVLQGSVTAQVVGADPIESERNHGYLVPPRGCIWGEKLPDYMSPPALEQTRIIKPYFHTEDGTLHDAFGAPFVFRGINNASAWYDICGQYSALEALDRIAATGANGVRIGWAFESIDPGGPDATGDGEKKIVGTNAQLLSEILYRSVELKLVPLIAFNDSTGQVDPAWPKRMARFITSREYREVFTAYQPYILLGIANEMNVPSADFASAYLPAVATLREAGLEMTLVITSNEWGQGCQAVLDHGQELIDADPQHNLLFDLHIYSYLHYPLPGAPNPVAGPEPERIAGCLNEIKRRRLPVVIGEFGNFHGEGPQRQDVAWDTIIGTAIANDQGYAPWLWYGDTEYRDLNLNDTWEGPLSSWGRKATSQLSSARRASIFD